MSMGAFAQNKLNLVVFSEDAEPFYTYVNGVKQNEKAETNVKITGLTSNISLRIVFENKALPEIKQNMFLDAGFEHAAKLKRDKKMQMKLRYFGQVPLEESNNDVPAVAYHSTENSSPVQNAGSDNTTYNTVTSTTTTSSGNAGTGTENVSVNITMSGVGVNMNVAGLEQNGATMQTTSSTTVTSSSSGSGSFNSAEETTPAPQVAGSTKAGCSAAMSQSNFSNMKKSVESKPFSDTRMSTAKVATKNACLSVAQVKEICKLFSMDDDKLAYAKYAYDYCVDKANYYQVSEVFSFSSTTDEFNKFLEQ